MGISLKKIAKQNRLKKADDLYKKITKNNIVHALVAMQLKGQVDKRSKVDSNGNVHWYWGLTEWFDENNEPKSEHFDK